MSSRGNPLSLYLHIPFCTTKCTYCAFNTYTKLEQLIPDFVHALCREIQFLADRNPSYDVGTIFFGGGTPTLLSPTQFEAIFNTINACFDVRDDAEITTEANPNDLSYDYLKALRDLGINRMSIGMQSADPDELKIFARRHDHEKVVQVLPDARKAGFDNLSLDLIYAAPYQTLASWRKTLNEVIRLQTDHISLYALGLEDGTPLKDWVEAGSVPRPDDDLAADMYDMATEVLGTAGFIQYEISNWALPGRESRHNLQYWYNLPYAGLGPGAHGFAGGVRYATIRAPQKYINTLLSDPIDHSLVFPRTPATIDDVVVERDSEIAETLIMGLRLTQEGIHRETFRQRFGVDLISLHADPINKYVRLGLLDVDAQRVRLTAQGRLLSNIIFRDLV